MKRTKIELSKIYVQHVAYTPNRLLDHVKDKFLCKNDAALARLLKLSPPHISKLRGKDQILTNGFIVAILDNTDLSISEVRVLAGLPTDWQRIAREGATIKDQGP